MKVGNAGCHADSAAGKVVDFNEDFYGWEKTTSQEDRQMKFGDFVVFLAEKEDLDSGAY